MQRVKYKRRRVAILGEHNSGKSALFNAILGVPAARVSNEEGTTTALTCMETTLRMHGPVDFVDTPGPVYDENTLAALDYAIYAIDINKYDERVYEQAKRLLDSKAIPHIVVFTKKDVSDIEKLVQLSRKYENTIIVSVVDKPSIDALKQKLAVELNALNDGNPDLISSLLSKGANVVIVTRYERIAQRQTRLIKDCLKNGIRCIITTCNLLEVTLLETARVDLVVTDLHTFDLAAAVVPEHIPLTIYSMLVAHQKGVASAFAHGARALQNLKANDTVLIADVCAQSMFDGYTSVQGLVMQLTGLPLVFEFSRGSDFPMRLEKYSLAVFYGVRNISRQEIALYAERCAEANVPFTDYDTLTAYDAGILNRAARVIS